MVVEQNIFDVFCNFCIMVMDNMSHGMGVSYGFINVMLFCILEPLAILFFGASTFLAIKFKGRKRGLTWTFIALGIACVLGIAIPCLYYIIMTI